MRARAFALVAVILFAVALVLLIVDAGTARLLQGLTLGGFTSLALAHAIP